MEDLFDDYFNVAMFLVSVFVVIVCESIVKVFKSEKCDSVFKFFVSVYVVFVLMSIV